MKDKKKKKEKKKNGKTKDEKYLVGIEKKKRRDIKKEKLAQAELYICIIKLHSVIDFFWSSHMLDLKGQSTRMASQQYTR